MQLIAATAQKLEGTALPERIVALKWGENLFDDGKRRLIVNETTVRELPANQRRFNFDSIALDFEHNSWEKSPAYKGEPVKIASKAHGLDVIEGQGIVLSGFTWTPEGRAAFEGGHYEDISPVVCTNEKDEVIFIHSAALCRQGRIPGLRAFSAEFTVNPTPSMDPTAENKILRASLAAILGVKEDADLPAIEAAAKTFAEKAKAAAPDKNADAFAAQAKEFEGKFQAMSARLDAAEKANDEARKDTARREAIAQGKCIPASANDLPPEKFIALCAELPADVVPIAQRTPAGLKEFSAKPPIAPEVVEVARQLGVKPEDIAP